jgi:hypothetical protein
MGREAAGSFKGKNLSPLSKVVCNLAVVLGGKPPRPELGAGPVPSLARGPAGSKPRTDHELLQLENICD